MVNYLNNDNFKKHMLSQREQSNRAGLKLMLLFSLVVLLLSFTIATESLGVFKQDETVRLLQTCSVCNYVTLDSVKLPNSTLLLINQNMTQSGSSFYYDFSATDLLGEYIYNTYFGNYTAPVTFEITYTGDKITSQQTNIYFVALAILILGALGLWFMYTRINGEHSRNERGAITLINFKGFLKPVILCGIWIIVLSCIFIISNLGIAFLPNAMIGNLFFKIYQVLFWITVIAIPVTFVFTLVKIVKSMELQRMINRGLEVGNDKL